MTETTSGGGLRRELHFWEAIALSIAIMAPTAAMALNGVGVAGLVGHAVPLAFLFATIGVLFVSYAFAQLTKEVSHAGSVYALTGFTLGARAGFLAGWALLGTYLCFTVASSAEVGLFFSVVPELDRHQRQQPVDLDRAGVGALTTIIAAGDIRVATRSLLTIEGISVALIVILVVVIFVKLIVGDTPEGHSSSLVDAFKLPERHDVRRGRHRCRVRLPVVRRLRGCGVAGRGDRRAAPQHPARGLPGAAVDGHLLLLRDAQPDARLRHERGRRRGVRGHRRRRSATSRRSTSAPGSRTRSTSARR